MPKNKSVARLSMVGRPVGRRYAKVKDAADYLDLHEATIRKWIDEGKIHAYRSGNRVLRVDLNEIDAMLAGDGGVA
jgi:excisionase family DNA binding protein